MKKLNACAEEKKEMESNAINVAVVVEGSEFFTLTISAQGEEALSHPAHHALSLSLSGHTANWELLEGGKYDLVNLTSLRALPGSWNVVSVH